MAGVKRRGRVTEKDRTPAAAPPPGRRPRLADVAARAGVSSGLVSLVLRNQPGPSAQTRARVLEAAQELGYRADRMASLLARRRRHARIPGPAGSGRLGAFGNAPVVTSMAMFFATCGLLTLLGALVQISPIWLYAPYQPGATTAGAVPDWYMGFLDGALRIMPGWEIEVAGHPLTLAVLVPALIVPGAFFTLLAAYPLLERKLTGDQGLHHLPDRPRDAATRTAIGAAGVTFYGLLWAAAANDQIAYHFHLDLFAVTWFFRVAVLAGPPLAYAVTRRICLGLVSREQEEAENGHKTGRIVISPDGGFSEITEPAPRALEDSLRKP